MLTRKTPLKRAPIRRSPALPEKPTKRHPKPTGPDAFTVARALARAMRGDVLCCEVCAEPLFGQRGLSWSIHHRRGREGSRTDNGVANLLVVDGADNVSGCHGRIHSRRSESRPAGWWLSRGVGEDPRTVPVLIDNGSRVVYFGDDGRYYDAPPPAGVA